MRNLACSVYTASCKTKKIAFRKRPYPIFPCIKSADFLLIDLNRTPFSSGIPDFGTPAPYAGGPICGAQAHILRNDRK